MFKLSRSQSKLLLFLIPAFSFPLVDVGFGTVAIYVVGVITSFSFVVSGGGLQVRTWELIFFSASLLFLCVSLLIQNSATFHYDAVDNNYIFRIGVFFCYFYLTRCYIVNNYSSRSKALEDFTRVLFTLLVLSLLFEYTLRGFSLQSFLYLYKARQDLGGIDSVHYNRFSGFTSFPGDLAAIIVLCFVCSHSIKSSKITLAVLFLMLMLTQSKAGLILLLGYYLVKSITKFSMSGVLAVSVITAFSIFLVHYFELEYFIKFLDNLDHYALRSKRAQEMFFFLESSWVEIFFGNFKLDTMYFESELFSTLNRNGVFGSLWFFIVLFSSIVFYFKTRNEQRKNLLLFLLMFLGFYCFLSAGFSRSKIGLIYIMYISILFFENHSANHRRFCDEDN
ncbi:MULTISPECIES: hypothetical protein [Vibrio]|uniref:hypothetical protein n=1 Tax=Vibrio TaxID=662 RepID=UPI00215B7CC7|nr:MULTISPECIES: hypothetical protein [Vibrio]MCR9308422.1 hypothetical protein [Vibrio diabolicus]MDU9594130.1 hypothetical protein [Vibrio sp. 2-1-2a]MDU9603070.1 hypothetical protein [Vibrio sp. 1-2-3a]